MSVRGGHPLSICSQIQKTLNLIQEGGQHFSNKSQIQKCLKYPIGGGGGEGQPYLGKSPQFSRFLMMKPPLIVGARCCCSWVVSWLLAPCLWWWRFLVLSSVKHSRGHTNILSFLVSCIFSYLYNCILANSLCAPSSFPECTIDINYHQNFAFLHTFILAYLHTCILSYLLYTCILP